MSHFLQFRPQLWILNLVLGVLVVVSLPVMVSPLPVLRREPLRPLDADLVTSNSLLIDKKGASEGRDSRTAANSRGARDSARISNEDQLTVCTLVDGRKATLSSDIEAEIPHLLETARAPSRQGQDWSWDTFEEEPALGMAELDPARRVNSVVLIDCDGVAGDEIIHRVDALQDRLKHAPFRYACVNTTDEAKEEWTSMWIGGSADHHIFPETYVTTLRLALHQCLRTECLTPYCAWSDSDLIMVPHFSTGWAQGGLDCLLGSSERFVDRKDSPVFATFPELSQVVPKVPREDAHWGAYFVEFSSQAFVVNRQRLFEEWLPIPLSVLNYSNPSQYTSKWNLSLRSEPFQSAIERLVVAKADAEYVDCRNQGRYCMPVVSCEPAPAWKVYYDDYKRQVHERGMVAKEFLNPFSAAFLHLQDNPKLDAYMEEISGILKRWDPPSHLHG